MYRLAGRDIKGGGRQKEEIEDGVQSRRRKWVGISVSAGLLCSPLV